jgi:predicted porin
MSGDAGDSKALYAGYNKYLDRTCRTASNIRIGGEIRLNDIALRAGYAYYQNPREEVDATQIGSVGVGYRGQYFYIDGAYSFYPSNTANYSMYDGNPNNVSTTTFFSKIAVSLGWRF